ncbi:MAG TPA: hypothetical protein P5077_06840 [bacterium]|nr:hypothetical protein [bacterium]
MRKRFVLCALLAMLAFIGCKNNPDIPYEGPDEDDCPGSDCYLYDPVLTDSDTPSDCDGCAFPDDDADITCGSLTEEFFADMPVEWEAYFTLKMSGVINDVDSQDFDMAFLAKVGVVLQGTTYNLADSYGVYMRDEVQDTEGNAHPAVVAVVIGNLTWLVADQLASIRLGQTAILVEDLLAWKAEREADGYGDVTLSGTVQVIVFESWIEIVTSIDQRTRMECVRGLSAMNGEETAYEGKMYFCWQENTQWAVGEQMKMMQYSKMIDDPVALLAVMNEGLTSEDSEYRADLCRCWEQDGVTPMDCEAMKAEFGLGELSDDDALLPD